MTVDALRRTLKTHRLAHGMSYETLARDLHAQTGYSISLHGLRKFILGQTNPNATTQYALETYLRKAA